MSGQANSGSVCFRHDVTSARSAQWYQIVEATWALVRGAHPASHPRYQRACQNSISLRSASASQFCRTGAFTAES